MCRMVSYRLSDEVVMSRKRRIRPRIRRCSVWRLRWGRSRRFDWWSSRLWRRARVLRSGQGVMRFARGAIGCLWSGNLPDCCGGKIDAALINRAVSNRACCAMFFGGAQGADVVKAVKSMEGSDDEDADGRRVWPSRRCSRRSSYVAPDVGVDDAVDAVVFGVLPSDYMMPGYGGCQPSMAAIPSLASSPIIILPKALRLAHEVGFWPPPCR